MTGRRALGLAWLSLLAAGALAMAQSRVRIVVVSLVEHQVEVKRPPAPRWTPALKNSPVVEGESIRTLSDGVAEVELECGSALRLTPKSELQFGRLRLDQKGVPVTAVTLASGEAFFTLQDGDSRDFQVQLPGAVLSLPHGGARLRLDVPAHRPASFEILSGRVQVQSGGKTTTVKSNHRLELLPGGGLDEQPMLSADNWQKWSHHRDQLFERSVLASRRQAPFTTSIPVPPSWINATISPDPMTALSEVQQDANALEAESRSGRASAPSAPYCAQR